MRNPKSGDLYCCSCEKVVGGGNEEKEKGCNKEEVIEAAVNAETKESALKEKKQRKKKNVAAKSEINVIEAVAEVEEELEINRNTVASVKQSEKPKASKQTDSTLLFVKKKVDAKLKQLSLLLDEAELSQIESIALAIQSLVNAVKSL